MNKTIETYRVGELLDAIAAKTPVPGGGAVAGLIGAISASLAAMPVAYSIGHKSCAGRDEELNAAIDQLTKVRALFSGLGDEDAHAYKGLNEAMKLPKDAPDRAARIAVAARTALAPPRALLAACAGLLGQIEQLAGTTNRNLRSDLAIAAVLAEAAARAAWWNISVNLALLSDQAERDRISAEARRELDEAAAKRAAVEEACL